MPDSLARELPLADVDDDQLVAAAAAGERSAYDQLVLRHQDRLYGALLRIVGSPLDAAEIAQDALVQAYFKLSSFRGMSQFSTWLYRIAMNLAADRRRRRRPAASLDALREQLGEEPADGSIGPEATVAAAEESAAVHAALAHLGDQPRKILVLRELEGCSYEQIADILELPIGTVRSRLFRARAQLAQLLRPAEDVRESP